MEYIPEITVAISFFSCGSWLAYCLLSLISVVEAQVLAMVTALVCGFILTISRTMKKRIMFIHLYLMALGNLFMIISGAVLISGSYSAAALLGGIGFGLVYVSGLSYLYVRLDGSFRKQRSAACHIWLGVGVAVASTVPLPLGEKTSFGYCILAGGAVSLVLIMLNEFLHFSNKYNYKKCLNLELNAENEKENNFDDVFNPQHQPNTTLQFKITVIMIFTKIVTGFLFNVHFLSVSFTAEYNTYRANFYFVKHCLVVLGMAIAIFLTRRPREFACFLILACVFPFLSAMFRNPDSDNLRIALGLMMAFYLFAGAAAWFGDLAIMDVSSIQHYEVSLAIGVALHQLPLLISSVYIKSNIFSSTPIWINVGLYLGLSIIAAFLVLMYLPQTYKLPQLEIQRFVLYTFKNRSPIQPQPPVQQNQQPSQQQLKA